MRLWPSPPDVQIDVADMMRCAVGIEERESVNAHRSVARLSRGELLPGWYEDWVLFERERLQQLRLAALESLAGAEIDHGNHAVALAAALEAIAIEPLRESAHAMAIRAHLLAGNRSAALREYQSYRRRLRQLLAIDPSQEMNDLLVPRLPRQPASHIDLDSTAPRRARPR